MKLKWIMSILDIGHLESLAPNLTVPEPPSYKARPLNRVWATAPYLHNGSVPNLTDLLRAPEERATIFYEVLRAGEQPSETVDRQGI